MAAAFDSDDQMDVLLTENNDEGHTASTSGLQLQNQHEHRSEQTNMVNGPNTSSKDCTFAPKKRNNTTINESYQMIKRYKVSPVGTARNLQRAYEEQKNDKDLATSLFKLKCDGDDCHSEISVANVKKSINKTIMFPPNYLHTHKIDQIPNNHVISTVDKRHHPGFNDPYWLPGYVPLTRSYISCLPFVRRVEFLQAENCVMAFNCVAVCIANELG